MGKKWAGGQGFVFQLCGMQYQPQHYIFWGGNSWKFHIQNVCSKISRSNYIITKVKNIRPKSSLRTLYSSLIQSYIMISLYGDVVTIQKRHTGSQKKAMRIINNKHFVWTNIKSIDLIKWDFEVIYTFFSQNVLVVWLIRFGSYKRYWSHLHGWTYISCSNR